MMFFQNGHPIIDTAYLQAPDVIPTLAIREDTLISAPPEQEMMAACFDHWHQNYYHWITHTIPTLFHLKNNDYNGGLILPSLTKWQEESIRMLGFDPARSTRTEPGKQYAFRKVLYTDCVKGAADFSVLTSSRQAYHTLTHTAHISTRATTPVNLFIERGQSPNRFVSNEAELSQALTQIGFTSVQPETFSLTEQIRLFSQAHIVIGALGAGMANLAWCKPGTIICELVPQQHTNPCTLVLAMQMQLQYWGEPIETGVDIASHITPANKTFDIPKIVQRAKEIIHYAESMK
ncbi:glycosyltransferase family 61 protein [Neokomagataea anthophila]|uniref:Glycosyltransferase family 61 protein n=1 Tax=Neokomagataea anthophila TaxID=2826925 RepID=A0ABS5E8X5_9PROT|nr:glycosyltransferase 61 family protein [Neokomagataea anthophila]MBR0560360.1 glycosyltransferase family 61 protein [Neokomagataea anthophila]